MILFMAFLILLMFVFVFAYPKFHADQVMRIWHVSISVSGILAESI